MPNEKTRRSETAVVVGGGLIGLAAAFNLQSRGFATILVDPALEPRPASWGNAGHIATEQVEPLASVAMLRSAWGRLFHRGGALALPWREVAHWLPFSFRLLLAARPSQFARGKAALSALMREALPAWHRLAEQVQRRDLLADDGHFLLWETPEAAAAGRAAWAEADTGTASFRDVTDEEFATLASLTTRVIAGAIRFEGTGRLKDPGEMMDAIAAAFEQAGGVRRRTTGESIRLESGRASIRLGDGAVLTPDHLVVAAGLGSASLVKAIGHNAPILAERGYHIQAEPANWPADFPPVVFEERSMIVSRFRSGLRAASFVELGRAASPPDGRKWQRLRDHVAALGIAFGAPEKEWMGARPTFPDYLPAIGRSARASNLIYAFGHQHLGLTLAAVTGEAVAALAAGEAPAVPLDAFDLARFD